MHRRLEDRIRELSARIVQADRVADVQALANQLRSSIREYITRMRKRMTQYPGEDRRAPVRPKSAAKSVS